MGQGKAWIGTMIPSRGAGEKSAEFSENMWDLYGIYNYRVFMEILWGFIWIHMDLCMFIIILKQIKYDMFKDLRI